MYFCCRLGSPCHSSHKAPSSFASLVFPLSDRLQYIVSRDFVLHSPLTVFLFLVCVLPVQTAPLMPNNMIWNMGSRLGTLNVRCASVRFDNSFHSFTGPDMSWYALYWIPGTYECPLFVRFVFNSAVFRNALTMPTKSVICASVLSTNACCLRWNFGGLPTVLSKSQLYWAWMVLNLASVCLQCMSNWWGNCFGKENDSGSPSISSQIVLSGHSIVGLGAWR